MKKIICLVPLTIMTLCPPLPGAETPTSPDTRCYELRIYYAAPGKLDDLNARFRDHTCKIFEKHGMVNVGYWVPMDNPDNKLIYLLAHKNREAAKQSWKEFFADPDWQTASKASEANGKLVAKVETKFLKATDYSPAIKPSSGTESRVFELRTYTTPPGKLDDLNARFRNHTLKLFTKHGMTNLGYWTPMEKEPGADNTLIYILGHKSREAAAESFNAFRNDSDWIKAKAASEANGSLTVPEGVKSVFMTATDYSPIK
ncbi:MAG TPA: NIPSNAP family protein [Candidatus Eisenbacteria bacterium]|nr:NIPSNAP family protein [Candidatus Eisenbacteria bacterium]